MLEDPDSSGVLTHEPLCSVCLVCLGGLGCDERALLAAEWAWAVLEAHRARFATTRPIRDSTLPTCVGFYHYTFGRIATPTTSPTSQALTPPY